VFACGSDVDVVVADRGIGNHFQRRAGFNHLSIDRIGDHAYERLLPRDPRHQFVMRHDVCAITLKPIDLTDFFESGNHRGRNLPGQEDGRSCSAQCPIDLQYPQ
jgi:hypothetical protein